MAAALLATERNAPISAAAPAKTSGHQKWNGTAESLNAKPTATINPPMARANPVPPGIHIESSDASALAIVGMWQVPSTPARRLKP